MNCPHCGRSNDEYTGLTEANQPYTGAASLCAYCFEFGIFEVNDGVISIRKPTEAEAIDLAHDPQVQHILRLVKQTLGPRNN